MIPIGLGEPAKNVALVNSFRSCIVNPTSLRLMEMTAEFAADGDTCPPTQTWQQKTPISPQAGQR
jgi:hypothetical protein